MSLWCRPQCDQYMTQCTSDMIHRVHHCDIDVRVQALCQCIDVTVVQALCIDTGVHHCDSVLTDTGVQAHSVLMSLWCRPCVNVLMSLWCRPCVSVLMSQGLHHCDINTLTQWPAGPVSCIDVTVVQAL